MATNVEIKARVRDLEALCARAQALSGQSGELISQEDVFFNVAHGRLKLRILAPDHGQLVYYERPDAAGPRPSHYFISTTSEPAVLRDLLTRALGVRGVVRKQRWLYWVGNTRVHLDQVEGLGTFMELEVVLREGDSAAEGARIARALMQSLGVEAADLVEGAYMDLLEQQAT